MDVDLLVIGWGKAGKTLAARMAKAGKSVALVEQSPAMYGGTCINVACVPTKDLVVSAEGRRESDDPAEYWQRSVTERDALVSRLNTANHSMLADLDGVTLLDGRARFTAPRTVTVDTASGEVEVSGASVIIGTGTVPARPPIPGIEGPMVFDSTTIQHIDPFPARLTIVGGGFIGLEFASMFAQFGSQVTLLERGDDFAPRLDRDVAEAVQAALEDRGVDIVLGAEVSEIAVDGTVRTSRGEYGSDAVLLAVGRTPATEDLGLSEAGIETDDRGFVVVDEHLRTSADGVFATGDVNGGPQFTYISYDDYRIVADQLLGDGSRSRADRTAVPSTTFLTPPLAQVGMSEDEARQSGRSILVASRQVSEIAIMPRPKIVGETHGVIKVLVDADDDSVLGATLFCTDAQEIINLIALAIRAGVTAAQLRDGIWIHSSSTEALNDVFSELRPLT